MEMGQDGVGPTSKTFAVLVRRHVAAGLTRQAIRAFDDMEAFIGREPDKEEFCMLLDTLCKYKYPKVHNCINILMVTFCILVQDTKIGI